MNLAGREAVASTPVTNPLANTAPYERVALGSSAGGCQAWHKIAQALSSSFPVPIIGTQHITAGFLEGFVRWLNSTVDIAVVQATHGEPLHAGNIYLAPDGFHLGVAQKNGTLTACLDGRTPQRNGFIPSVSVMFESVARTCGAKAIGGLLTGMGLDGAYGLLAMRHAGASTFIQDEHSSLVFGMPRAALEMGAADKQVPLDGISRYVTGLFSVNDCVDGSLQDVSET